MNKLLAVLVAGLFSAGAFAQAPAHVSVPVKHVHRVAHAPLHHVKKHKVMARHYHHRKAVRHHAM
ncbi:hypothetical protein BH11PSE13_BH11PSE13_18900 [soil metagenome]